MMITQTLSYGLFMLVENILILYFIWDMIVRTLKRIKASKEEKDFWTGGFIFLAYLLCVMAYNISETYIGVNAYLLDPAKQIEFNTVVARVFSRSMILMAKFLLWYYTTNYNFEFFRKDSKNK